MKGREKNISIYTYRNSDSDPDVENAGQVNVSYNMDGNIRVNPLIENLKKRSFPIEGAMLSYFSKRRDVFIFIG
jgi:hypothetical protein